MYQTLNQITAFHQIKESDRIISVFGLSFYEAACSSVITIYMLNSLILHWESSSTVSRLAPGLALGTSVDVCASMSRHSHAAEKGPCETLPS